LIKESLIKQLNQHPNVFEKPDGDDEIDIACVTFAFDNAQVMKLL